MNGPRPNSRSNTIVFLGLVGLLETLIFFRDPYHFFQGDTIAWLNLRYHSLGEFLRGFFQLDPGGWYRPLTQRTVESVFYPTFGLNPLPYRLLSLLFFFACTTAVFFLIRRLAESQRAAYFGTLFFSTHIINMYTTYDTSFTPELLYTLFYICSAVAYLSYLKRPLPRSLVLSVIFFALSLVSKETAITLPFVLALLHFTQPGGKRPRLLHLAPHFLILGIYFVCIMGYLHVGGFDVAKLIKAPNRSDAIDYDLTASGLPQNVDIAFSWMFGLPRVGRTQWSYPEPWMSPFLQIFRAFAVVALIGALFTKKRTHIILGLAWFWMALGPMLPLQAHFFGYYLFGPLVGFAWALGVAMDSVYEWVSRQSRPAALALFSTLFGFWAAVNANAAGFSVHGEWLLGQSSDINSNAIANLRASHPKLPRGMALGILDQGSSMAWTFGDAGLFRLGFNDHTIRALYASKGALVTIQQLQRGEALALHFNALSFEDRTQAAIKDPLSLLEFDSSRTGNIQLSRSEVEAGKDSYVMRIPDFPDRLVDVMYRHPNGTVDSFKVKLDARGEILFNVGADLERGDYAFLAINPPGQTFWIRANAKIKVK